VDNVFNEATHNVLRN